LLQSIRTRLLPRLDEVRRDWQFNHDSDERPEGHMQQLLDGFETLRKHFRGDPNAATTIEREIRLANEWIAEATPEEQEKDPRILGNFETPNKPRGSRSIFDDVDA
jgi:hypothetical protein